MDKLDELETPPEQKPVQRPLILVVDDDPDVLKFVGVALQMDGFRVMAVADGSEVLQLVRDERPELVILDIMMPQTDGYALCQQVRSSSKVPIIMLTAKAGAEDIVRGLNLGADDYVTKPFNVNELALRVKAVLHRTKRPVEMAPMTPDWGDLVVDPAQRLVRIAEREIELPTIEFRLFSLLTRNAGEVITHKHLLTEVWGPEYDGKGTHVLEAAIARLRKRLACACGDHNYIGSQRGMGYYFSTPVPQSTQGIASQTRS